MKKFISVLLLTSMLLVLCACELTPENSVPAAIPTVSLAINGNQYDFYHNRIFPTYSNRSFNAYAHIFVESEKPQETIRVKIESQWGQDEDPSEDFKVVSDEIMTVDTNQWTGTSFNVFASNLYFYRVTVYYGEEDIMLASKTIYTPYEYSRHEDFTETAPAFHPYGMNEYEQTLYDNCQYAIINYAKIFGYRSISSLTAFQTSSHLYIGVDYSGTGTLKTAWFAVNLANTSSYKVGNYISEVIPDNISDYFNVLDDYFYVEKALCEALLGE